MVVSIDAALQAGKEFDDIIEHAFDIVVELVTPRARMHDEDRAVKRYRIFMKLLLHIVEVRHSRHIVVLRGIGVETDELDAASNERIVKVFAKHRLPHLVTRTEEVMIANEHDVRLIERLEDIVTPFKLAGCTRVREVATMDDKVNTVVGIDGRYFILKLFVPQMRVTDKRHTQRIAVFEPLFNDRDILGLRSFPPL